MSRPRTIALLLTLVTLLAYLPVARDGFSCYDDSIYVTDNPIVQNGLTWAGAKWAFTTWYAANWHPLTWLSYMLDCELFELNAGEQHYVNVLFHAANAVLLLLVLVRLTGTLWPGAFVAALFAWHPLHVESVAWVAERKDVLSTFFEMLALLAYVHYAQRRAKTESLERGRRMVMAASESRRSTRDYLLALSFFALGLMAKPMLVTLPFVMLLCDYWPLKRFPGETALAAQSTSFKPEVLIFLRLVVEKWPFFLLSVTGCVVTLLAQRSGGALVPLANVPLHFRLENIPVAYARYLLKTLWPVDLAVFYPLDPLRWPAVTAAAVILLAITGLVWRIRRRCPYGLVGWLWFLGALVPVIGLVEVGSAAMADRYTYFPSVGIFLFAVFGLRELAKRFHISGPAAASTASLTLLACLTLTEIQLRYWRNDVTLFSHAIAVTRNNDIAYLNLGYAFEKKGEKTQAMAAFRTALQIAPKRAEPHNNVAILLADAGNLNEALAEFQAALLMDPDYVAAHENLGTLLVQLRRFDEATNQYAEAARLDPEDWHAPYLMGKALLQEGQDAAAVFYLQQALKINPNSLPVLDCLAQVLASDENSKIRDGREALALASKAYTLSDSAQPAMLDLLAMACAELGRFDEAVKAEQGALTLAAANGLTNDADAIRQHLQLYQQRQPFRQPFTNAPVKELPKN